MGHPRWTKEGLSTQTDTFENIKKKINKKGE